MDSGRWRWTQRSSSAAGVPSSLRKNTIGSPRIIRPNGLRATSWSEAATYQKFFRNMGVPPGRRIVLSAAGFSMQRSAWDRGRPAHERAGGTPAVPGGKSRNDQDNEDQIHQAQATQGQTH